MPPRQLPRLWLMTDERRGGALWAALARLPRGSGVVFRHKATPRGERRALFDRVRAIARARGLVLVLAGPVKDAIGWRANGVHGPGGRTRLRTMSAHDAAELAAAWRAGADAVFLSPLFATRSHPEAAALGRVRFAALARASRVPVIALGGVRRTTRGLAGLGAYGWAAIDGLSVK